MDISNIDIDEIKSILDVKDQDLFDKLLNAANLSNININKFFENENELIKFLNKCNFSNEQIKKINKILTDINQILFHKGHVQNDIINTISTHYNKEVVNDNCEAVSTVEINEINTKVYYVLFILLVIVIAARKKY